MTTATMDTVNENTNMKDMPDMTTSTKRRGRKPRQSLPIGTTENFGENSPDGHTELPKDVAPKDFRTPSAKKLKELVEDYTGFYVFIGMAVSSANPLAGMTIIEHAEKRATELINMAKHHKNLISLLDRLRKASDMGTFLMGHLSMLYVLLVCFDKVTFDGRTIAVLHGLGYDQVIKSKYDAATARNNAAEVPIYYQQENVANAEANIFATTNN